MNPVSKRYRTPLVALTAALALTLSGCAASASTEPDEESAAPLIIVTHSILADVTANIAGEEARVQTFIPVGADPHTFSPSTREIAELYDADLIIHNGLGLEETIETYVNAAADSGVQTLNVGEGIHPLTADELYGERHDHDHDADDHHDHGPYDPHFWHDVERMQAAVNLITHAIGEIDGVEPPIVQVQATAYSDELQKLETTLRERYESVPEKRRVLVTQHRVLGYLAHAHGYEQLGSILPGMSTVTQANAADIARLVHAMDAAEIPAMFSDETQSDALAQTVRAESSGSVEIIPLFSESLTPVGGEAPTYIDLMLVNSERIVTGLTQD